jgi:serine/threonine protein kinase
MSVSPLKSRHYLAEVPFNTLALSRKPIKKRLTMHSSSKSWLNSLPYELQLALLSYLTPAEVCLKMQGLNKLWHDISNDTQVWAKLEAADRVDVRWRVACVSCIVERRSKGKLFKGFLRKTRVPVTLRRVNLDVANAGCDDGVPTSVLREIAYLSELKHPNIAEFYGAQLGGASAYICAEFSVYNLKDYCRLFQTLKGYHVPLQAVKSVTTQILNGLEYLHHRGLMHRNLKADNILMTPTGSLKIADFTLSRQCLLPHGIYTPEDPKERERSGREARRLWYRPPELLFRKDHYSFEVDIWAVGCLLAEVCTNEPLFNGESEVEQMFKIFKLTGSPAPGLFPRYEKTFPKWESFNFADVLGDAKTVMRLCQLLVPHREATLDKLHRIGQVIGPLGLDFLQRCLELDPQRRMSASQALSHEFLRAPQLGCCNSAYPPLTVAPCFLKSYGESLRELESELLFKDYLGTQPSLNETMRSILVDWLIDVSVHFEVSNETLHYAVSYIDRSLSVLKVERARLQLVGVACMKIADVFNERSKEYYRQDNAVEYAYITADEFTAKEVVAMEKEVLNVLNFRLQSPTTMHFLKSYLALTVFSHDTAVLAQYLADLMLLSYSSLAYLPSLIAASCLLLASTTINDPLANVSACRKTFAWHSIEDLRKATEFVRSVWTEAKTNASFNRFDAVNAKYEGQFALEVRQLWPPNVTMQDITDWWFTA